MMSSDDNINIVKAEQFMPGYNNMEAFTTDGYKILMEAIRCSNSLPNGQNWNFYNVHEAFVNILGDNGNRVLTDINMILHHNGIDETIRNRSTDEKIELIIEANDIILERIANNIDEMNGFKKTVNEPVLIQTVSAQLPVNGSWNRLNSTTFSVSSTFPSEVKKVDNSNSIRLLTAKNIIRPQVLFKDKIVNSCKYPWEPRIKEKPNSLKPLSILLEETDRGEEYSHPYELELNRFKPSLEQLAPEKPEIPLPVENTPLIEINTSEQVDELVTTLKKYKVFAVDLEHHSYRSFMGITCLMQISTIENDYIIDTLELRDKLYVLNEVFTDPTILKVFHGADTDILWLQRDLSLYVVNMFDTHQAAKQLDYSSRSLSFLMQKFCNLMPNKQFQLADWRIRPLPKQLKCYAREDTHYLIYIYQMLKEELLKKSYGNDYILSVYHRSTDVCKKRYFRPVLRPDSYLDFYRKCKRLFDNRQLYALKELYNWRDQISREEDESTGYVLPNHMLLQISEMLPREMQGILACCNPIPPLVRANALEIHQVILKAREQHLEKPILKQDTRARGTTMKLSRINVDSPLHCPHDLTNMNEFCEDLSTVLGNEENKLIDLLNSNTQFEKDQSVYSIFNYENTLDKVQTDENKKLVPKSVFLGPFDRYKLVKPYIEAEEKKKVEEKAKNEEQGASTEQSSVEVSAEPDNRTDEQRIESIREHFLNLSRLSESAVLPPNHTLLHMGGAKKRKREASREQYQDTPKVDPCSTVPHNNKNSLQPVKRKSSGSLDHEVPKKKPKNKLQLNKKRKQQESNRESVNCNDVNNVNQPGLNNKQYKSGNGKKKNRGKRNKKNLQANNQQSSRSDLTPYDYSSVDFRQFQGGASHASGTQEFRGGFRSKNQKKGGNLGHNRSSTFSNFQRGRGKNRGCGGRGGH